MQSGKKRHICIWTKHAPEIETDLTSNNLPYTPPDHTTLRAVVEHTSAPGGWDDQDGLVSRYYDESMRPSNTKSHNYNANNNNCPSTPPPTTTTTTSATTTFDSPSAPPSTPPRPSPPPPTPPSTPPRPCPPRSAAVPARPRSLLPRSLHTGQGVRPR
eukprot:784640-Rhodomonas_salina.1